MNFDTLLDNLITTFMVAFEARKRKWSALSIVEDMENALENRCPSLGIAQLVCVGIC
jgi:hypothetical protein